MIKLCIWMNIPSHHQSAFFQALAQYSHVDLAVRYFAETDNARIDQGWNASTVMKSYEMIVSKHFPEMLDTIPDWESRIHLIALSFSPELVAFFVEKHVSWCHWSEMPGIRLAKLLHFNPLLFRFCECFYRIYWAKERRLLNNHALCVFAQGELAVRSHIQAGVNAGLIHHLYYAPAGLPATDPVPEIINFAKDRNVFLVVGSLSRRKGTDLILKAFYSIQPCKNWVLVFCGKDLTKGWAEKLARTLGISSQVLFLGSWPAANISEVFAGGHVLIQMSRFDGWCATVNEAASCGLPVIASKMTGSAWHLVQPDINGYRIDVNVKALKKAMLKYVENDSLRIIHGIASRKIFAEGFSPEKNADRLIGVLKSYSLFVSQKLEVEN